MAIFRHIEVRLEGDFAVASLVDRKIIDAATIQELGDELYELAAHHARILIDFRAVEYLSSAALNKFIVLEKRLTKANGRLVLCRLIPSIRENFVITKLHLLFTF